MIKFFRHLRQAMIKENRVSKYLLYAFGEIVLVMIGILLALQVSNWNSQRKLRDTNQVLLNKMVGELDLNIDRMVYLDSLVNENGVPMGLNAFSLRADTAITLIEQGLDSTKIQWLINSRLVQGNTLNLHASVYEEMKNTGRLYSLGSDSLLVKINRYYGRLEREAFYTDDANNRLFARWTECKYGFLLLRLDYSTHGVSALKNHPWLYDQNSKYYQDLKIAIHESSRISKNSRSRMWAIIKESASLKVELLNLLKSEDK